MARSYKEGGASRREDAQPAIDEELGSIIRASAHRLVAKGGLPQWQISDVEQDLTVAALEALGKFNPERGCWKPYVKRAIDLCGTKVLRSSFAQKRNHRRVVSLNVQVQIDNDEGLTELSQLITCTDHVRRLNRRTRDEHDAAELAQDLAILIASLPLDLQKFARALKSETILQYAQRTGPARSTLYDRLEELRDRAVDAGLADYLP